MHFWQSKNKYYLAILVFLIVPLSGVSTDIYVPSLPAVSHYFFSSKALAQLTITAYLIGIGGMQLFAGSISDSFGRKKPFMIAMLCFIATTFLVLYSRTIYELIFLRFMQGVFLAVVVVPIRSVISDLFEGKELQKMMTYLTIAWSVGPIVAPGIGGYLQEYFGWEANFYFLGIYSVLTLIFAWIVMFETSTQRHDFKMMSIIKRYYSMLSHREYVCSVLTGSLLFSIIALFGIVGSFFIQTMLHYKASQFGQFNLLLGAAWFSGSMTNRFMLHVPLVRKARIGFGVMWLTAVSMLGMAMLYPMSIYVLMGHLIILFFFSGILYPSYFIHCTLLFRHMSASSNGLYNASVFFISGLISAVGTLIKVNNELPFIGVLIALVSVCLVLYYLETERIRSTVPVNT